MPKGMQLVEKLIDDLDITMLTAARSIAASRFDAIFERGGEILPSTALTIVKAASPDADDVTLQQIRALKESDPDPFKPDPVPVTGNLFTLKESVRVIDDETQPVEPVTENVLYWGDSQTQEGVPFQDTIVPVGGMLGFNLITNLINSPVGVGGTAALITGVGGVLNALGDLLGDGIDLDDLTVELINNNTLRGDNIVEGVEIIEGGQNEIIVGDDGYVNIVLSKTDAYTGNYELIFNLDSSDLTDAQVRLTREQFDLLRDLLFDDEGNIRLFEKEVTYQPQVPLLDENGDPVLDIDGNEIPVDLMEQVTEAGREVFQPIILTPTQNNGGTIEAGFTTGDDDTIVVGRLDLLHQAYIDGGGGYDTLEVDAKGYFAQPLQLLNIQHVSVQNLPNIYDYDGVDPGDIGEDFNYGRDGFLEPGGLARAQNSILDLSRATSIEKLTVTEGGFVDVDGGNAGSLILSGIRNAAELNLEGGFSQDLVLNYGRGNTQEGLDIVLNNVDFHGGADLAIAHNANTFNLESLGGDNHLNNIASLNDATLSTINVSGGAHLHISGNLGDIYNNVNSRLATFDAAENTGGVNISFNWQDRIAFTGSQADDVLTVRNAHEVSVVNAAGANRYDLGADDVINIVDGTGDNLYDLTVGDGGVVSVSAEGEGRNKLEMSVEDNMTNESDNSAKAQVATLALEGDRNTAEIAGDTEELNVTMPGARNSVEVDGDVEVVSAQMTGARNSLTIDGATEEVTAVMGDRGVVSLEGANETVDVTLEGGNGMVFAEVADVVTISAEDGNNTFDVIAENVSITTGGADNTAFVSGTYNSSFSTGNAQPFTNGALLSIAMNGGLVLGHPADNREDGSPASGVTALEGSTIGGDSLGITVMAESNLTQAELSGITSVVMNDTLVLDVQQFLEIGPEAFAAYREDFGAKQTLQLVVNGDTDLSGVDLSSLRKFANDGQDSFAEAGVELELFVAKGAELTLTAQQLHENVAETGIKVLEKEVTDGNLGSVVITEAGSNFDPFAQSEYELGGTLSGEFNKAVNLDVVRNGDFERPGVSEPTDMLTLNSDDLDGPIATDFTTLAQTLKIVGESDVVFEEGTVVNMTTPATDGFTLDFSELEGNLTGLTLAEIGGTRTIKEVLGNNTGTRINVELDGNVGSADSGLVSSGVETYMVTNQRASDSGAVQFWTSTVTKDLETLGLQGNYGQSVIFGNVDRGVEFLMEAVDDKFNSISVGELTGVMARESADGAILDAVVNVTLAEGVELPEGWATRIEGINLVNAETVTINVDGGDARIESLDVGAASELTITSADSVSIMEPFDLDGFPELVSVALDVSGVQGDFAATLIGDAPGAGLTFSAAQSTTTLTLDGVDAGFHSSFSAEEDANFTLVVLGETDLSAATLENVDTVRLGAFDDDGTQQSPPPVLSLTVDQVVAIGASNIVLGHPDFEAEVNLTGLSDQPFSKVAFADGIEVSVTLAELPEITLHPDTDLTGFNGLNVPDGTTLTLSGEQLVQLVTSGGNLKGDEDGESRVVVSDFSQEHVDALRDWAAAEETELDFSDFLEDLGRITIEAAGNLELGSFQDASFEQRDVVFDNLTDADDPRNDSILRFDMGGNQLTLATFEQANGLLVNGGDVKFTFVDEGISINMAGYTNIGEVEVYALLVNRNDNIEDLFLNLASSVHELENVIRVVDTPPGLSLDRAVIIDEGVTTVGDMQFITADDSVFAENVTNVWINFEGGSTLDGNIVLDLNEDEAKVGTFDTLYLISRGEDPNTITGGIVADGTSVNVPGVDDANIGPNNFLNLVIDTNSTMIIEGDIEFNALLAHATANLTLQGEGDVYLSGLDFDGLAGDAGFTIDMSELDGSLILTDDVNNYDWTGLDLTIIGNSATNPIVLAEDVTLTLTAEQANGLHIVAEPGADTAGITVNIVDLQNNVTYDFTGISEEVAGRIELDPTEPEDIPATTGRVQLEEGTNLGYFSIHLVDDQLIGFRTPDQADGQVVTVENGDTANIAWLFNELNQVIDASGYSGSIERLFINDELVMTDPEVEQFWTGLHRNIEIINIRYTGDLDFEIIGTDRTFEVSGFAQLSSGLDLVKNEDLQFYENVTIKMGGGASIDELSLDNVITEGEFDTLRIESGSFDTDNPFDPITNVFAPDFWLGDGSQALPTANTIGDISSGDGLRLTNVELVTTGLLGGGELPLNVGTITFDADTDADGNPVDATLTLDGGADITIKALEAGENVSAIDIEDSAPGFTGTLDILSGSPAIFGDELESITIGTLGISNGPGGNATVNIGVSDMDSPGVAASTLTEFNASAFGGTLNVQFSEVNGDEFTFTAGAGVTTVHLGDDMELADDGEWTFDLTSSSVGSSITLTDEVTFGDGDLTITLGDNAVLILADGVDLSDFDGLTVIGTGQFIFIPEDAVVTMTVDQYNALGADAFETEEGGAIRLVGEGEFDAGEHVGQYILAGLDEGDMSITLNGAKTDVDITREGNTNTATVVVPADVDPEGTWDGFQDGDVLDVSAGNVNVSGVNDGASLGGIDTVDFDDATVTLSMTEAQHNELANALNAGDATIAFTEPVGNSALVGLDGVGAYELFDDDEGEQGNVFQVAATDQEVTAGAQGDRLYANLGADTFELGAGEDTVVYTDAGQSFVVTDFGDSPAPTVVPGSDDQAQFTQLQFLDGQDPQPGDYGDWIFTLDLDDGTNSSNISFTGSADATLSSMVVGLFNALDADGDFDAIDVSPLNNTLTIGGAIEGAAGDFSITVTIEDDLWAEQDASDYVEDLDDDDVYVGDNVQEAADATAGSIEITISDDDAALVNALNLEINGARIVDYEAVNLDLATNGATLAYELLKLAGIASAVYDDGVLTLTASGTGSIDVAADYDAPLVEFNFDSIVGFVQGEDQIDLSDGLAEGDWVGKIANVTATDLYEAAQQAAEEIGDGDFGYFQIAGNTYVFANIGSEEDQANSDDLLIELQGVFALTADDFVLA